MSPVALVRALRPKQWVKNGLLTVAIVFAGKYTDPKSVLQVIAGVALFCLLSSAGYLVNDLRDVEADRLHPKKKHRPIAAGEVPAAAAWATAAVFLVVGLAGSFALHTRFGWAAAAYLATTLLYSAVLKSYPIFDVMGLASGFIIRAVAGAEAIQVEVSGWFLTCIGFGALFIGLCKRQAELRLLAGDAGEHRKVLNAYSDRALDQLVGIAASCSLISYALYTFEGGRSRGLMATLPIVIFAVFRYLMLVGAHDAGGEPSQTLLEDKPLLASAALFMAVSFVALHFG